MQEKFKSALALALFSSAAWILGTHLIGPRPRGYAANLQKNGGETCAAAKSEDLPYRLPEIARDLKILQALPASGRPIHRFIHKHNITSCFKKAYSRKNEAGNYLNGRILVYANADSKTSFHEYFHAQQDKIIADADIESLDRRDRFLIRMFAEAAATAYSLVVAQEAENSGIVLRPKTMEKNSAGFLKFTTAADNPDLKRSFDRIYRLARETQHTERSALALAGQQAVRFMMQGNIEQWVHSYAEKAFNHTAGGDTRQRRQTFSDRDRVFRSLGHVSADINLTPPEMLGAHGEQTLQTMAETLNNMRKAQTVDVALTR